MLKIQIVELFRKTRGKARQTWNDCVDQSGPLAAASYSPAAVRCARHGG
jgi:hypothetical protein